MNSKYTPIVAQLLTYGDCGHMEEWPDYLSLGMTDEQIPELILMIRDEALHLADSDSLEVWAPIHAWRTLGQLRAEAAIVPLLRLLERIDEEDDDWVAEELPPVFGMIGATAIPALQDYLANHSNGEYARVAAAVSHEKIGQEHPEARDQCVAVLTEQLKEFSDTNSPDTHSSLNAFVINALVELKAVESAPVMAQAFEADQVDETVCGDWEDIQIQLGLLKERLSPRKPLTWPVEAGDSSSKKKNKEKAKRKQARKSRKKNKKR